MSSASNEEREVRAWRNQALFRAVNEKIMELNGRGMTPLAPDFNRSEFLRHSASVRMEARLIREAAQEARDRSLITCARSRMLLERCARTAAQIERGRGVVHQPRS